MFKIPSFITVTGLVLLEAFCACRAESPAVLSPPPQDQGLPYTRSARASALAKIKGEIAVFAGSRYAYVDGFKVRLDQENLRGGEAIFKDGRLLVPPSFAGVLALTTVAPEPAPDRLADRWVYDLKLPHRDGDWVDLADAAAKLGFAVYQNPRGLLLIGHRDVTFLPSESALLDSVITLFDTPEKLADPDIATRSIPDLARQRKWTDHVKVTTAQLAALNGPETAWPTAPKTAYDYDGFDAKMLGSKVPPPGVYPRLLFSPEDVPAIAARVKASRLGQMSLIEMKYLFSKSFWDPKTDDGRVFKKLSTGDLAGLEWDIKPGTPLCYAPQMFKGEKPGIYNSHVAYVPECLNSMAFYCLITGDDVRGRQVAAAVANYYKLREPLIDEWLRLSDSEFGSSTTDANGVVVNLNGAGAATHWRNIHGLVAHMNLGLSLDFAGKWMTADQKETMRRIIAKVTYGRRSYAQDAPVRFRDVNWMGWDLTHFLAVASIEGLPGFDPEAYASGAESVRAFCDWGIDDSGVVFESDGKTPGSFQFITLSMATLARRGENLFGHPHWRKLIEGQIQMTSPSGRVTVNSGTQYVPYSRQSLSLTLVNEFKGFYPSSRLPDYLVTKAITVPGAAEDEYLRGWPRPDFDPVRYTAEVPNFKRLRLPSVTYPGFVRNILYDRDTVPTTRADLNLPLDFNAPAQGVFSSYSDRTPEAVWMNLYVRPHHYLGAGHHHADAGMFHFSGLGVDWFTQSPFDQEYSGNFYDLVQVDGKSEPYPVPGFPFSGILGYNGAATYLGATTTPLAAVGSADLTYAYSWRWLTQPPQVWTPELQAMGWELDPSPENLRIWAGTSHYKMRPWWTNYTYSNYIPTCRASFNPMQYVYRTTGLIRGAHPYGFVLDDLKKDDRAHLFQWTGMFNEGVWTAQVPGLSPDDFALGYDPQGKTPVSDKLKPALRPRAGDPVLLVCALGQTESGQAGLPLFQALTSKGPPARNGKDQFYDHFVINRRATAADFKVLLIPVRMGEAMPQVSFDGATGKATVVWPDQTDVLTFVSGGDHRSRVQVERNGKILLQTTPAL